MFKTAISGIYGELFGFGLPHAQLEDAVAAAEAEYARMSRKRPVVILRDCEAVRWVGAE